MATADLLGSLMTGDRFLPAVAVGLGVFIVLLCLQLLKTLSAAGGFEAELHGYQKDFLDAFAKSRGQPSAAAARWLASRSSCTALSAPPTGP